jgi:alpha-L-fucosidase
MRFAPTLDSLNARAVPAWFDEAKLGIFIHWGLFSVPGFASGKGSIGEAFRDHYDDAVTRTPYTEWYWNAIRVPGSESARHHREVWGDRPYQDFRGAFLDGLKQWDPHDWAARFAACGARYAVLVTKHHDGFCLWPSAIRNPHQQGWTTERDVVGELGEAVRARGLRFGVYYSGGIDWTFNREPLRTLGDFIGSVPGGDYPAYAEAQLRELIARYSPDVLWNDIAWPAGRGAMLKLFADYYEAVPDGVINDRWMPSTLRSRAMRSKLVRRAFDRAAKRKLAAAKETKGVVPPLPPHCDFRTPEYTALDQFQRHKWEATRGLSHSFGFNRADTDADYLSTDELVRGFVDIVSRGGNLLLNVGPRGEDAQIPSAQLARLDGLGCWLKRDGAAIYAMEKRNRPETRTGCGLEVRLLHKGDALYAHVLGTPKGTSFTIAMTGNLPYAQATHVATGEDVRCEIDVLAIRLHLKAPLPDAPAHAFKLLYPTPGTRESGA